ncbi:hypothetical protein DFH09DRAFT_842195, partial [Mycena vulgaris]
QLLSFLGDCLSIALPVSQANTLFAAQFEKFSNPKMRMPFTRTLSVSLPEELVGHMEVRHPTTAFDQRSVRADRRFSAAERRIRRRRRAVPPDSCKATDDSLTPACLQTLYGIPTTPATQTRSILLVKGYTEQWAQRADLVVQIPSGFLSRYPPNTTYALDALDGGTDPQQNVFDLDIIEGNIDIQYTVGPYYPSTSRIQHTHRGAQDSLRTFTFLSVGDDETEEAFFAQLLDTTIYLAGVTNPPSMTTTSCGGNEVDFGSSLATKICNGYMALGARGVSVLFASGNGVVRDGHDDETQCTNNPFISVFLASCPYVTSVGATTPESFSSGGFSNFFSALSYQS